MHSYVDDVAEKQPDAELRVLYENLKTLGKNYQWLVNQLKQFNIKPEDALIVTIDGKNQFFYQVKDTNKK